jgi:hypothetical protein
MDPLAGDSSPNSSKKEFNGSHLASCCVGQTVGCGFSFMAVWIIAFIISVLLTPLFGQYEGDTAAGMLLSLLSCGSSVILGAVLSFLVGRFFPIFKK